MNRLPNNTSKNTHCLYFCKQCFQGHTQEDLLQEHKVDCQGICTRAIRVKMPVKGKITLKFRNYQNQLEVPYVICTDFEALMDKIKGPTGDPTLNNTQKTAHHEVCGFSYIIAGYDDQTNQPVIYRGPTAAQHLIECLQ